MIELGLPALVRLGGPKVSEVVLLSGEPVAAGWLKHLQGTLENIPVTTRIHRALLYVAEQRVSSVRIGSELRAFFQGLFSAPTWIVWAHNQGLGRNLLLTQELTLACRMSGVRLVLHQHDWWFDNRWSRWAEMRKHSFRTLDRVAETLFPADPNIGHVAINGADAKVLKRHLGSRAHWIPNPAPVGVPVAERGVEQARRWLEKQTRHSGPFWIMPCRLLRRKNIAEALLLTRWLQSEARLITTGGVTSAEEESYALRLAAAAKEQKWPLTLQVLSKQESSSVPDIADVIRAAEVLMLTSLQEGFGLPYLEAAEAGIPLVSRTLPNIAPDLAHAGLRFHQEYEEVLIDPVLFDWDAEVRRQNHLFAKWQRHLPECYRSLAGRPVVLSSRDSRVVPLSRLTLTAQLEVLAQPTEVSWELCHPHNPHLREWKKRAAKGQLRATAWTKKTASFFSLEAYAQRFEQFLAQKGKVQSGETARALQDAFVRSKLATENLYPLTWNSLT